MKHSTIARERATRRTFPPAARRPHTPNNPPARLFVLHAAHGTARFTETVLRKITAESRGAASVVSCERVELMGGTSATGEGVRRAA